jgi:hypothetical protein
MLPISELSLALPSFKGEPSFLVCPDGTWIRLEHPEEDTVQVKGIKAMMYQQTHRFRPIALVPITLFANVNAELGRPVAPVNLDKSTVTNQLPSILACQSIWLAYLDCQHVFVSGVRKHGLEPAFLLGLRKWPIDANPLLHLRIVDPFHKGWQVIPFNCSKADPFAVNHLLLLLSLTF